MNKKIIKTCFKRYSAAFIALLVLLTSFPVAELITSALEADGVAVKNGDFESGTEGYANDGSTDVFETVVDPDNASNHIMHFTGAVERGKGIMYQDVEVKPNTDYIWTARIKQIQSDPTKNDEAKFCVYQGGTYGTLSSEVRSDDAEILSNIGVRSNKRWGTVKVYFNSGDFSSVRLGINGWASTNHIYLDDWSITEGVKPPPTYGIRNGDFENGTASFIDADTSVFEVLPDVDDPSNHVLHISGTLENNGKGIVKQNINVVPETDYIWSFRLKENSNNTSNRCVITVVDNLGKNLIKEHYSDSDFGLCTTYTSGDTKLFYTSTRNCEWSTFYFKFNSGSNSSLILQINAWTSTRDTYIDDWKLEVGNENLVPNPGFEEGTEGYVAEGVTIETDTDEFYRDATSLKMTGAGKVSIAVDVEAYTNYTWTFYIKSKKVGSKALFGVRTQDGGTLFASTMNRESGLGVVMRPTLATDRPDTGDSAYHQATVTSNSVWSKYSITFKTGSARKVVLTYKCSTANAVFYTDHWDLRGDLYFADETFFNGDFEEGAVNAYLTESVVTADVSNQDAHGGSYAAKITKGNIDNIGSFYQSVNVKKNTDYLWTFWLKFDNNETPIGAMARKYGGSWLHTRLSGDYNTTTEVGFDWQRIRYVDNEWHRYTLLISTGDNEVIDIGIYTYAANVVFLTDDWSLECLGDTPQSNTVFDIGFEDEDMGVPTGDALCWFKTDTEAKNGNYSVMFDGSSARTGTELLYRGKHGVSYQNTFLSPDTYYRFSFWYKGKGKLNMANLQVNLEHNSGGYTRFYDEFYGSDSEEWTYIELIFKTEKSEAATIGYRFNILGTILGSAAFKIYVDDIKLEKIIPGITDGGLDADSVICTDNENMIPDGAVNSTAAQGEWNASGLYVAEGDAHTGTKAVVLEDNADTVFEVALTPNRLYNFAVSYKTEASAADAKIGLSFGENGEPFNADALYNTTGSSIFEITDTNGEWKRSGYTFNAPENGKVYIILKNTSEKVYIDDIMLYSLNPVSKEPKDMTKKENEKENKVPSIWDEEFDFDFDWSMGNNNGTSNNQNIPTITTPEESETKPEKSKGKRYLQVKKRTLISKGKPGVNVWLIVGICSGAVVGAAGITLLIIFLVRRRKKPAKK